jgi:hypothetical protein
MATIAEILATLKPAELERMWVECQLPGPEGPGLGQR